ncbi:MAG: pilus assembly protein N-terminal domain-containing protein [Bryobacteraceae bacterium]|nr:pilus assembly protein N-terminal domain-containing protein [Bryobacteraceae bacterium]MCX7605218.1 pilus assembly protein N-terminal domain-containing protein [Bryobacteraceae bacterium]
MKRSILYLRPLAGWAGLLALAATAALAQGSAEDIRVTLGKSVVIDYPEDVSRISTSNPEVVDYVPVSTREILLHAKGLGTATLVVWAKSGQRNMFNVNVEMNLEPIRRLLRETFPGEDIQVTAARDSISLNGTVSSQAVADRAAALLQGVAKNVVNNLRSRPAPAEKQVLLRVKFAELNRNAALQLGTNLMSTGALNTPGIVTTGQFSPPRPSLLQGTIPGALPGTTTAYNLTDALNIFAFRPDLNVAATIKALQIQGLLQILAEPNLLTSNGKEASFLVGGEFPVPVLQGGANAGAVTVQFREFGIRLTFTPNLTENGTLKMYVKPEVSTIDMANSVTLSGFTIPALATRRVESNIELAPGQSFVIGGLIDDRTTESLSRIPGLANIPVLGALFRSRNENRSKTELIVLVTPEIVEPASASDARMLPAMPYGLMAPMMLPNGMPGSSGEGAGARPAENRKDLYRRAPASGKPNR